MNQYINILNKILTYGVIKPDRTGTGTKSIAGCFFEHDMSEGFPLLTTKRVPFNLVASELEFFIHGITDKQWLLDRNNHIWDEWCSSDKVMYGHDDETKHAMLEERELGPLYGWQWRNFGGRYKDYKSAPIQKGIDQFQNMLTMLKHHPDDRRMLVVAWNPLDNHRMALPPCHWAFQVTVSDNKINLMWNQRSVDSFLGLPFNIASYGLLLHLLSKETGYGEGRLCGFLGDTHIYLNHLKQVNTQIVRDTFHLCKIETTDWTNIFDWCYVDTKPIDYKFHPYIKAPIAI